MNQKQTVRSYVVRNDLMNKELEDKITKLVDSRFGTIRGISIMRNIVIVKMAKDLGTFTKAHIEEFAKIGLDFDFLDISQVTGQLNAVFDIKEVSA